MFTRVRASLLLWNLLIPSAILLAAGSVTYFTQRQIALRDLGGLLARGAARIPTESTHPGDQLPGPLDRSAPFTLVVDSNGHVLADPQRIGVTDISLPKTPWITRPTPTEKNNVWINWAVTTQAQQVHLAVQLEPPAVQALVTTTILGQRVRLLVQPAVLLSDAGSQPAGSYQMIGGSIIGRLEQKLPASPNDSASPIGSDEASSKVLLITGASLAPVEESLRQTLIFLLIGGAAGLLLSMLGSWFLAGRALIPIQQAFRRQQEFVADAAHELRTPLTVLQTSTHLLNQHRHEPLDSQGGVFDDLHEEIGRLTRLSCDLLDLAQSDIGQLDLALGSIDLQELGQKMVRRLSAAAAERGIDLRLEVSGRPPIVEADSDRLQQALMALLDNALKHTPPGGLVTLGISESGRSAEIEVRDTGEGIPPEALGRIFDRFYRGDRARSRSTGGAGLGLAIAKTLIEAHGGTLTLSSVLGSGTTATVRLPLTAEAPVPGRWPRARRRFLQFSRFF
ncbi:MAG: hypothetical protein HY675_25435 [Chloroflexi bacterium]|nr:hypothetical protein [Chloroflexota bacterium]